MSRRSSKSLEQEWYDLFADWELADQEAALRTLTELHRQAIRQAERKRQEDPTLLVNIFREPEAG
jgi:signal transduction histidine kinase